MRQPYRPKAQVWDDRQRYKDLSDEQKAKVEANYRLRLERQQASINAYYAKLGIEVELFDTVLPVSGGRGFGVQYYQNGAPIRSLTHIAY